MTDTINLTHVVDIATAHNTTTIETITDVTIVMRAVAITKTTKENLEVAATVNHTLIRKLIKIIVEIMVIALTGTLRGLAGMEVTVHNPSTIQILTETLERMMVVASTEIIKWMSEVTATSNTPDTIKVLENRTLALDM